VHLWTIKNIGQLNINHKVLKEGTKNTENDKNLLSELGFVGLKDFGIDFFRAKAHTSYRKIVVSI
jgi:hypothetical protein